MDCRQLWVSYYTIVRKEVLRFVRIWPQTLLPPVITVFLYFIIFGSFLGNLVGTISGLSYIAFLIPGLMMMSIIESAFSNVVSSLYVSKFQREIEEILVSPMPNSLILAGYITGGVLRGIVAGILVLLVASFFYLPTIKHPLIFAAFLFLTSLVFALAGLINGIYAKKFDDITVFSTFILTPLTYLGGVFYSINSLPPFWRQASTLNPIFYMIDGLRYGFYGVSEVNVMVGLSLLMGLSLVLGLFAFYLLEKGIGLKN